MVDVDLVGTVVNDSDLVLLFSDAQSRDGEAATVLLPGSLFRELLHPAQRRFLGEESLDLVEVGACGAVVLAGVDAGPCVVWQSPFAFLFEGRGGPRHRPVDPQVHARPKLVDEVQVWVAVNPEEPGYQREMEDLALRDDVVGGLHVDGRP